MNDREDFADLYRLKESQRKSRAQQSIAEKMAIATRLREVQEKLAPVRAANKAKRRAGRIEIRFKTG
jgi:hypothetical protein